MNRRRSIFTLIELVVAIGILVMVATIVGMAGASFYQAYERSLRVTAKLKSFMAVDNLMDTHIRNMIPFKWKDEEGTSRLLFDGEENRIMFATLRRSYGDCPGALLFVRIFVEDEKLIAEYSPYPRFPWQEDGDESMPFTREVIAENVLQVTFLYAEKSTENSNAVDFLTEYREEENSYLPLAVMMKLEFTDGSTEQWLRRVAGVSKESSYGYREDSSSGDSAAGERSSSGGGRQQTSGGGGRQQTSGGSGRQQTSGGGRQQGSSGGRPGRAGR